MSNAPQVDHEVAIVGTGFGGLGMAIKLKKAGMTSFVLFEKAGSVGGTWRDNTYPGAACDVQSHLYSFSFEPNPRWSHQFARQEEILAYLEYCTDRYGIEPYIRFDTAVDGATFDEQEGVWTLRLSDGSTSRARVLVSATGGLSQPLYPNIDGLDSFQGDLFHSARWNHDCDLTGKRVAVIGTGASAIQIVPQVAKVAAQLDLYQRSGAWVLPKPDRPIPEREQRLYERLPLAQRLQRLKLYWRLELRAFAFVVYPRLLERFQKLAERHIANEVQDPELRDKLTPSYTLGCKRVLMANDYYPALQRDNVEVVTSGIDAITPRGIRTADGAEHGYDVIILCTGFKAAEDVVPYEIRGVDGVSLDDAWAAGAEAYLGTNVHGFPNLFMLAGPNTGLGHSSMVFMLESQINLVMSCLRTMRRRTLRYMDVRPDVQDRFNRAVQRRMSRTIWSSGCTSWYQTSDGKITTLWPGFTAEFRMRTLRVNPRHYNCAPALPARRRREVRAPAAALEGAA
jgi:cation diffusion facilitator CzcD-associated flavoprotein CzcO